MTTQVGIQELRCYIGVWLNNANPNPVVKSQAIIFAFFAPKAHAY